MRGFNHYPRGKSNTEKYFSDNMREVHVRSEIIEENKYTHTH